MVDQGSIRAIRSHAPIGSDRVEEALARLWAAVHHKLYVDKVDPAKIAESEYLTKINRLCKSALLRIPFSSPAAGLRGYPKAVRRAKCRRRIDRQDVERSTVKGLSCVPPVC